MGVITIPAPYGGINQLQGAAGDPKFAMDLREWIPRQGYCELRHGFSTVSAAVAPTSIHGWTGASGTTKLVISESTTLKEVTTAGVVTGLESGLTANTAGWYSTMFQNKLILTSDAGDTAQVYDGSSTTDLSTTGAAANTLWGCHTFKGRVYYWKKNDQAFWYAAAASYQGALVEFPLNTVTAGGGYLVLMATITNDGGEGADDLAAFVMSTGEVLVYQGDDPAEARSWQLIGRFNIGRPLSQRGACKVGPSVFVMTTDGVVNLQLAMTQGQASAQGRVSAPLGDLARRYATSSLPAYPANAMFLPSESLFIAQHPLVLQGFHVMETNTGAWTTWTPSISRSPPVLLGLVACAAVVNDVLYIGGNFLSGALLKYDTASFTDADITGSGALGYGYIVSYAKQNSIKLQNGRVGMITTASPRTNYDRPEYVQCRVAADGAVNSFEFTSAAIETNYWSPDTSSSTTSLNTTLYQGITAPVFAVTVSRPSESFNLYTALTQKRAYPIRWYETRLGWKMGGSR